MIEMPSSTYLSPTAVLQSDSRCHLLAHMDHVGEAELCSDACGPDMSPSPSHSHLDLLQTPKWTLIREARTSALPATRGVAYDWADEV
jgi:hypothetical protein